MELEREKFPIRPDALVDVGLLAHAEAIPDGNNHVLLRKRVNGEKIVTHGIQLVPHGIGHAAYQEPFLVNDVEPMLHLLRIIEPSVKVDVFQGYPLELAHGDFDSGEDAKLLVLQLRCEREVG